MLRHPFDSAGPSTEQPNNELPYLGGQVVLPGCGIGIKHLLSELSELWILVWIWQLEVAARTNNAVEIVTELDVSPEDPVVHRTICWRIVGEADAARTPIGAEERP